MRTEARWDAKAKKEKRERKGWIIKKRFVNIPRHPLAEHDEKVTLLYALVQICQHFTDFSVILFSEFFFRYFKKIHIPSIIRAICCGLILSSMETLLYLCAPSALLLLFLLLLLFYNIAFQYRLLSVEICACMSPPPSLARVSHLSTPQHVPQPLYYTWWFGAESIFFVCLSIEELLLANRNRAIGNVT